MPTRYQFGAAGSQGFGTPDRTCLRGIRMGLQDLTCWEHQIEHAYRVSGRGCRISRVRNLRSYMPKRYQGGGCRISRVGNYRSYMPTRYQEVEHVYEVSERSCMISRARNTRSYMSTMYQVGVAGSHGLSTTDRTCLLGIRRGLQNLTGSNQQIERAYYR